MMIKMNQIKSKKSDSSSESEENEDNDENNEVEPRPSLRVRKPNSLYANNYFVTYYLIN